MQSLRDKLTPPGVLRHTVFIMTSDLPTSVPICERLTGVMSQEVQLPIQKIKPPIRSRQNDKLKAEAAVSR